jgi:uncharacterized Zn finger protein
MFHFIKVVQPCQFCGSRRLKMASGEKHFVLINCGSCGNFHRCISTPTSKITTPRFDNSPRRKGKTVKKLGALN